MSNNTRIEQIIGQPEGETLEYKAVLPPSRSLAQMIASFANSKGGYIVLGVTEILGRSQVAGLSSDFYVAEVVQKAIELLTPQPIVILNNVTFQGKIVSLIQVNKSGNEIAFEGKVFIRTGDKTVLKNDPVRSFKSKAKLDLQRNFDKLSSLQINCSGSKLRFLEHYKSVLNIVDDVESILYPITFNAPTTISEGKILTRILFSSCADNFESYLSDLLYEIYLANPNTLKSEGTVTVKEILNCTDIQEFIIFYARKKISKLQRGSVIGFIAENREIADLRVLDEPEQQAIEKLMQIRHLYSHRNGIVDEKFIRQFPGLYTLNTEHCLSSEELVSKMISLAETVDKLDKAAIIKHSLATVS